MSYYVDGAAVPHFAAFMTKLAAAWDARITEERIRVYAQALSDVPWPQLQSACAAVIRESRWFPSIAEIRSKVTTPAEDMALIAWSSLDRAARRVGAWSSIVIDDGAAAEALITAFGSWPQFVEFDDGPALGAKRQEFLAAYRQAVRHKQTAQRVLPGLCESSGGGQAAGTIGRIHLDGTVNVERERLLGAGDRAVAFDQKDIDGRSTRALAEGRQPEDDQA